MIPPESNTQDVINEDTNSQAPGEPTEMTSAARPSNDEHDPPDLAALGVREGAGHAVDVAGLHAYYGDQQALKGIDIHFPANEVTAIIGPSGCGKSTMVRCINRMHEEIPGARTEGSVMLDGLDSGAAISGSHGTGSVE